MTAKAKSATLPAGFQPITRSNERWDMDREPLIEGVVVEVRDIKKGGRVKNDTRVMDVRLADGRTVSVWQSAALRELFDEAARHESGTCEVALAYRGTKKIPGRNTPMRDIIAGIKPLKAAKKR